MMTENNGNDDSRRRSRSPCWVQASFKIPPLYQLLGIEDEKDLGMSDKDLTRLYKKLALKFHPDRIQHYNQNNSNNNNVVVDVDELKKQFQKIQDAYSVLGDAKKRAEYDSKFGINRHLRVEVLLSSQRKKQQEEKEQQQQPRKQSSTSTSPTRDEDVEDLDDEEYDPSEIKTTTTTAREKIQDEKPTTTTKMTTLVQDDDDGEWAQLF